MQPLKKSHRRFEKDENPSSRRRANGGDLGAQKQKLEQLEL
jgi:hypothetical protein